MDLNLLILFAVLSPSIIGTISSENINESTDLLVRKKRVINTEPGGDVPAKVGDFPYVVKILLHNKLYCVGSIISVYTVITSAQCASSPLEPLPAYKILSGTIYNYGGTARNVIERKLRFGNYDRARNSDGIALLIVAEPFTSRYTGLIPLHSEPIVPGEFATVAGWGCYFITGITGTEHPRLLRSITVPIMPHRNCVSYYRGVYNITDEDICINDEFKHCGHNDFGGPLIIHNKLAGVYVGKGPLKHPRDPEIFVELQHAHYRQWIRNNTVNPGRH